MLDRWLEPWLDSWLDLVHGAGCVGCAVPGRSLCSRCAQRLPTRGRSVRPTPCPDGLAACFAAGEYDDLLRAMVLAHKEHDVFGLAGPLGGVLAAAVAPVLPRVGESPGTPCRTVLVPVPSRAVVVRERGHDPMLRMVRVTARRLRRGGVDVQVGRLLEVRDPVADQAGLSSVQRAANLAGSMQVRAAARVALARTTVPVSVVVCDDVLTTGATAREAQRALETSGVPVRAVVTVAATRKRLPVQHLLPGRRPGDRPGRPGTRSHRALPISGPAD